MEERTNELELVEENDVTEIDGYVMEGTEDSDEAGLDLANVLKWVGIGVGAIGVVAIANRKRIKEKIRKSKEKRMRKYADELGYDIVDPDDYIEADYEESDEVIEKDCELED